MTRKCGSMPERDPAFVHSFDPASARRQFMLSIALVAALALAAFVLGFLFPILEVTRVNANFNGKPMIGRLIVE